MVLRGRSRSRGPDNRDDRGIALGQGSSDQALQKSGTGQASSEIGCQGGNPGGRSECYGRGSEPPRKASCARRTIYRKRKGLIHSLAGIAALKKLTYCLVDMKERAYKRTLHRVK